MLVLDRLRKLLIKSNVNETQPKYAYIINNFFIFIEKTSFFSFYFMFEPGEKEHLRIKDILSHLRMAYF